MKTTTLLIAAMSVLLAFGACTKPGVEDDSNILPPTKKSEKERLFFFTK